MVTWEVIGKSVPGASHGRSGLPNQDAILWHPDVGRGETVIAAVADGHGSARSFRSETGAKFAVETAVSTIRELIEHQDAAQLSAVKRLAEERLPRELWNRWKSAVEADIRSRPFSEQKTHLLGGNEHELLAYGSTLLFVLITPKLILYVQLGDGDIVTVSGDTVERPLPKDERLFANATTSLCTKDAWQDFRIRFQAIVEPPELILIATDGYANSFRDDEGFLKAASDIRDMIRNDGADYIREHIEPWLTEASESGSGDDITVCVVYN
jgi:serine/threonine protein phosphatase PrpC